MSHRNRIRRSVLLGSAATLLAGSIAGVSSLAYAQDQDDDAIIEEIIVTGTRIRNPNISSPSPVTVIDSAQIDIRGVVLVEDLLGTLPQTFQANSTGDFGASGVASVDLRGLGANRTLVLVDGYRLPFGASNSAAPDLNQIPAQLVERIEVLTGGASAVYGADAVAGVVNFIMQRDFEGMSFDAQIGIYQTGNDDDAARNRLEAVGFDVPGSTLDGFTHNASIIIGTNTSDGRGNITAYATYRNINSIVEANRIGAACAVGGGNPEFFCLGSSTTFPARLTDFGLNNAFGIGPSFDLLAFDPDTFEERDFVGSGAVNDTFNFASTQRFQRPDERFTFGAFAHYEINDNIELYLDTAFSNTKSQSQIGPSGTFFTTDSINCDNPFFTALQLQTICTDQGLASTDSAILFIGRRDVEGGPRRTNFNNTTFRLVGGFRGSVGDSWEYDLNGQYSAVNDLNIARNDIITPNLVQALDAIIDPDTGAPACRSFVDGTNSACVPYNIFTPGGVTEEALNFILGPGFSSGRITQKVLTATFTGDLGNYGVSSPMAETGVQILMGFDYRQDTLARESDSIRTLGQLTGFGGATLPVDASIDVYEFFTEVAIPLVQGQSFAQEISATLAYRFSDYSTTGTEDTYAVGLVWAVDSNVKFRAQFQRATRAPNVFELFLAQNTGLFDLSDLDGDGIFDPCAGPTPARTATECARTGVTANLFGNVPDNPAGQFNLITGGNPNLEAEKSDTITLGVIITPEVVPGLTISVDYFDIDVKGFIGTVPPELALNNCLDTGDEFFCSLVQRDAGGSLFVDSSTSFIVATNINTGSLSTSGVDINAAYSIDLPGEYGSLNFGYVATYLIDFIVEPLPGETPFDCAGFYSSDCGSPNPHYKHTLITTWQTPNDMSFTLTWRYIGSVDQFTGPGNPPASSDSLNATLGAENYYDLSISAPLMEGMRMRMGINNILDNNPPTSSITGAGFGNGNTFPGFYDSRGRFAFLGVTYDF